MPRPVLPVYLLCAVALLSNSEGVVLVAEDPCVVTPSNWWKPQVQFSDDLFIAPGGQLSSWVKFTVLDCEPSTVFFQNSLRYRFHYDFAVER